MSALHYRIDQNPDRTLDVVVGDGKSEWALDALASRTSAAEMLLWLDELCLMIAHGDTSGPPLDALEALHEQLLPYLRAEGYDAHSADDLEAIRDMLPCTVEQP